MAEYMKKLLNMGLVLAISLTLSMVTSACTSADPDTDSHDRDEVVKTVLTRLNSELGKTVKLDVKTLNIDNGWAMIDGKIQDENGQPVNYAGTKFAEDAAVGGISKRYDGLLEKTGDKWDIRENAIGPTDIQWVAWKKKYSNAPSHIFELPME